MARPVKQGMDYFPHDTDAASDEKIEALRALHGNDGYAFYFVLLERIYRTENGELSVENEAVFAALLKKIGVTRAKYQKIIKSAFELFLLDREKYENEKIITSDGIKKRFDSVNADRKKKRAKYNSDKPPKELEGISDIPPPISDGETTGETTQSKEKERKEKESINSSSGSDVPLLKSSPFLIYFGQKFPIPNPTWAEVLLDLETRYPLIWLQEATKLFLLSNSPNLKYLEGILKNWTKIGGEEPWNEQRGSSTAGSVQNKPYAQGRSRRSSEAPGARSSKTDWGSEPNSL